MSMVALTTVAPNVYQQMNEKTNMGYPYNEILSSHKKEGGTDTATTQHGNLRNPMRTEGDLAHKAPNYMIPLK